jgi:hypothetical protein
MPEVSDLAPFLTQKPIVLIVEDRETKEYLYATWGAEQQYFNIVVSGGNQVVKGVVEDLRRHGHKNVFGLVNRDFGKSNVPRWQDPSGPPELLRWSYHEIENLLLDWNALAGCRLNRRQKAPSSSDEIELLATAEAQKQPWWLACRKCLSEIQKLHGMNFPSIPSVDTLSDLSSACNHIANSQWFKDLPARTKQIGSKKHLQSALQDAYNEYCNELTRGDWIKTFSGKEIYKSICHLLHDGRTKKAEFHVDIARSVGEWQLANSTVPPEVDLLRTTLKIHVGIR